MTRSGTSVWPNRVTLPNWRALVCLPEEELGRLDIAAVNLACAEGLPGANQIDPGYCLYKLDDAADQVKEYTALLMPQFRRARQRYENSEAYFRTLAMITVLQRDCDVRYNPAKIPKTLRSTQPTVSSTGSSRVKAAPARRYRWCTRRSGGGSATRSNS